MTTRTAALIVAGGRGSRLAGSQDGIPKQYLSLGSRPVLAHTLDAFLSHAGIDSVIVVIRKDDEDAYAEAVARTDVRTRGKLLGSVHGGETRQLSVLNGLRALPESGCDTVLIHDAARPFVTAAVIDAAIAGLAEGADGVLAAVPVVDTLKRTSEAGDLVTVDRTNLWAAQTPQGFRYTAILAAHERAFVAGRTDFTDDTGLAEWDGMRIRLTEGDPANFKITTAADLARAQRIVEEMDTGQGKSPFADLPDIRLGTGYDVHAFEEGNAVILGGVEIPHDRKLKGHSDADVVLHAITDATLGAIADGDIGQHFPPSDPQWKGASSDRFQHDAIRRVEVLGGRLAHVDVTIVCEAPKIGPHRQAIRESIAAICGLALSRVSVKATTSERLGFTGRREGIAAMASVTVRLPYIEE